MGYLMRSALAVAVVLSAVYACGRGFTSGPNGPFDLPDGSSASQSSNGDAGADSGVDGGLDAGDAGCTLLPTQMQVVDLCGGSATGQLATIAQATGSCTVTISFNTASAPCTGSLDGGNNAFAGDCAGLGLTSCTSTSLPGSIHCAVGTSAPCSIVVCDSGTICP
jgi:hypothetical protein